MSGGQGYCVLKNPPSFFDAGGVAEFAEGLGFDLADALAGDVELAADLIGNEGSGPCSIQPVFNAQAGHLFEINRVARQQCRLMNPANGGDLQILSASPRTLCAQSTITNRRLTIKWKDGEIHQQFEAVLELLIPVDLADAACFLLGRMKADLSLQSPPGLWIIVVRTSTLRAMSRCWSRLPETVPCTSSAK